MAEKQYVFKKINLSKNMKDYVRVILYCYWLIL